MRWVGPLVTCLAFSLSFPLAGCGKKKESARESAAEEGHVASSSLVEVFERGSIAWNVDENGKVLAFVHDESGGDASKKAKGTIEWTEEGQTRSAKLEFDAKADALVAAGPPPKDDLNEIRYALVYEDEPVKGTLHLPRAGTAAITAEAEASAKIDVSAAVPPHGGVVQVVGEDRVEIVADDDTDEVRVYLLDASWQPVVVVDRTITIAVGGASPEVIVLTSAEGGAYFVGHWHVVGQPPRVTVMVKHAGKSHVAIVGWRPGVKLAVDGGPKVKVKVKAVAWGPGVHVKTGPAMVKVKAGKGGPSMVKVNPNGKVKVKIK